MPLPDIRTLAGIARKFRSAVRNELLGSAPIRLEDAFHARLTQEEIDDYMELEADETFFDAWRCSTAMAGSDGVPAHITARLKKLDSSRNARIIRLGNYFAKIVAGHETAAIARVVVPEQSPETSEGFRAQRAPDLARLYAPRVKS